MASETPESHVLDATEDNQLGSGANKIVCEHGKYAADITDNSSPSTLTPAGSGRSGVASTSVSPYQPQVQGQQQGMIQIGSNPASSTSSSSDRDGSRPCQVCEDRGTGYHYSVFSCEGCKGFFKRTVQKQLTYSCRGPRSQEGQGSCIINKASRNNCQFCRFQKCLTMGMKTDAVREDRLPGGKPKNKKQRRSETEDGRVESSPSTATQSPATSTNATNSPQSSSTDASGDNSCETGIIEQWQITVKALVDAQPHLVPDASSGPPVDHPAFSLFPAPPDGCPNPLMPPISPDVSKPPSYSLRGITINELMKSGYQEVYMMIRWAKMIPGFKQLCLDDQMALLKASFMDLNVLRLAYRSRDILPSLQFTKSISITAAECYELGWGSELPAATVEFSKSLVSLDMDLTEFCIINALVICYPDASGLVEVDRVTTLQTHFLECLQKYDASTYPDQPRRSRKILLRLPTLRKVSAKAMQQFLGLKLIGKVEVISLVREMMNCTI